MDSKGLAYYVFLNADVDLSTAAVIVDQVAAGIAAIVYPVGVQVSGKVVTLAPGASAVLRK